MGISKEEVINLALETYGTKQQLNQTNEELAELIVEVAKNIRGYNNKDKVVEEMADVLHCFEYLKIILNITDDELSKWFNFKISRTYHRIQEGYDVSKLQREG